MNKYILFFLFLLSQHLFAQEKLYEKKIKSQLKIPYNTFDYNEIEGQRSDTIHTALKPWHFYETNPEIIQNKYRQLLLHKKSWFGRKLFDEHFFAVNGPDYWISIDPVVDERLGKDNLHTNTFQNTRAIRVEGALGRQFSFSSTIAENYALLPKFIERYVWVSYPHIVPGFGLNKSGDHIHTDYPYATGYIAYKPSRFFFFELGHGKHFIGEGYRSLFLSDNASNYPYFQVSAKFWHVKYTTMWTAYQDLRPEFTVKGVYKKKFSAIHYISWNATKKLNFGFFESVIWYNENRRGFDVNFLNPLIFFKTAEFEAGSNASNTVVGLSSRYKLPYKISVYGQFLLDEMTVKKFFGVKGYWANKFGYQIGLKYHDAFNIPHLFLRTEYNHVRPYTYAHNTVTNYAHNYQALAHPWGANFKEFLFEQQYRKNRLYAHNILIAGQKGFDFPGNPVAYGGDVYRYIRPQDKDDNKYMLQGNAGKILYDNFEAGYIINPATNLKLFAGFIYRKTGMEVSTQTIKNETVKYVYIGVRTHLWNDHFDLF